jgi:hypothetical protein
MDTNLPTKNNNPGDLRMIGQTNASQGQGGFADFPTPQDGYTALLNDIQTKINRNPSETLEGFSNTYAPEDDGNDPAQYTVKLANQLGVSPMSTIGSLQGQIGKFADAIANNEGYQSQNTQQNNSQNSNVQTTSNQPNSFQQGMLNSVEGIGGAVLNGIGNLFSKTPALPILGAVAGAALTDSPVGGLVGENLGSAAENALGGNQQNQSQPSDAYNQTSSILGSTVGGQQVIQEGKNRGIDPVSVLEQTGGLQQIQPYESGNFNKPQGMDYYNGLISNEKQQQQQMEMMMTSPTNLYDMQKAAEEEVSKSMSDTGEKQRAIKEVQRIFNDYRSEQPTKTDKNGKSYVSQFVSPARLQKKKELLSVNEKDFARPQHERAAAAHVKEAMRKRLSKIAKQDGIKNWDEVNRKMEAYILAKKAIKHLPKKAERNKGKEFRKDLIASLLGAGAAKVFGKNSFAGGLVGHLIERQLGKKEYKKLLTSKKVENFTPKMRGLMSRIKPSESNAK